MWTAHPFEGPRPYSVQMQFHMRGQLVRFVELLTQVYLDSLAHLIQIRTVCLPQFLQFRKTLQSVPFTLFLYHAEMLEFCRFSFLFADSGKRKWQCWPNI